jgi:hypothetical protein
MDPAAAERVAAGPGPALAPRGAGADRGRGTGAAAGAAARPDLDASPDPGPARVHRVGTPSGEIAWTVDREGSRVIAAGGAPGRLDALRARLAGAGEGFAPPTEAARAALSGGLGGAAIDVARLVASVRALPPEAFGTGPSGFVLRSMVNRLVDPAERLLAVSARAELEDAALVVSLEAEARPRPGASP